MAFGSAPFGNVENQPTPTDTGFMVKVQPHQADLARQLADDIGDIPHSASAHHRRIGLLGEIVLAEALSLDPPSATGPDPGFDLVLDPHLIDVKTIERSGPPHRHYLVSVHERQLSASATSFAFMSLTKTSNGSPPTDAHFCGWTSKKRFLERAASYSKGDFVPLDNGFHYEVHEDCRVVTMNDLLAAHSPDELVAMLQANAHTELDNTMESFAIGQ